MELTGGEQGRDKRALFSGAKLPPLRRQPGPPDRAPDLGLMVSLNPGTKMARQLPLSGLRSPSVERPHENFNSSLRSIRWSSRQIITPVSSKNQGFAKVLGARFAVSSGRRLRRPRAGLHWCRGEHT